MKLIPTLYRILSTAYFSTLLILALVAFMQGRYEDVAICLFWAIIALVFGMLTAKLLELYQRSRDAKSKHEIARYYD